MATVTEKPLIAYPNRGGRWNAEDRVWESNNTSFGQARGSGEDWNAHVAGWYRAGARLIGGCCRTTPRDIREISASLEALARGSPE
jgi:homocysteine S-methyltransferase